MAKKDDYFKHLVEENHQRIIGICHHYATNSDDEQDIYQEILINIWKSLDSFRGDAAISTWIYRIAVNTALGFNGKEFRRLKFHAGIDTAALQNLSDEHMQPSDDKEIQVETLRAAVNQLSVIDNALISLTIEGLSTREIAEIIGITEPNVRVKIHRIKAELFQTLKNNLV